MPTLVLVRHAQAAYNYPDRSRPLTDAGRDQAARLGATLAREVGAFSVAVSSDAQRARNVRHAGLLHPADPIGDMPRGGGHGLVPDPVTVFTFVHEDATHMGKRPIDAIECAGIYPPNREK